MTTPLTPRWSKLLTDMDEGSGTLAVANPSRVQDGQSMPFEIMITAPGTKRVEIIQVVGGSGTTSSPWALSREQRGTVATKHFHGAKVSGVSFWLTIGNALDLTGRFQSLVITGSSPGGDESLTCTAFLPDPVVVPTLGSAVELSDREGPFWIGILEEPRTRFLPQGGAIVNFTAQGYVVTTNDDVYTGSKTWDPADATSLGVTIAEIVKDSRNDLCPLISVSNTHVTGGGQGILTKTGDAVGKTAQSLWNEYIPIGDAGFPIAWHIHGFGTTSPQLELTEQRTGIAYTVNLEDTEDGAEITWRRSETYSKIMMRWKEGVVTATNSTTAADLSGAQRALVVDASSHIADLDHAIQVANTLLHIAGGVQAKAVGIKVRYPKSVAGASALWRLREGDPIRVLKNGSPLSSGNSHLPIGGLFIRHRSFDFAAGRLTAATSDELTQVGNMVAAFVVRESGRLGNPSVPKAPEGYMWGGIETPPGVPAPSPGSTSSGAHLDQSGRMPYEGLAEGADTVSLPLESHGGADADGVLQAIPVGSHTEYAVHTPMLIHTAVARLTPTDPATTLADISCTVEIYKIPMTVGPTGTLACLAPVLIDTIVMDSSTLQAAPGGGFVLQKRIEYKPAKEFKADDWVQALVTVNPESGGATDVFVTLRGQKAPGQSTKPTSTTGAGVVTKQATRGGTASPSAPTPGATFQITTSDFARVQVQYGPMPTDSTPFAISGWSAVSPLSKTHTLTIPAIPSTSIRWDAVVTDQYRHQSIDSGNILF